MDGDQNGTGIFFYFIATLNLILCNIVKRVISILRCNYTTPREYSIKARYVCFWFLIRNFYCIVCDLMGRLVKWIVVALHVVNSTNFQARLDTRSMVDFSRGKGGGIFFPIEKPI